MKTTRTWRPRAWSVALAGGLFSPLAFAALGLNHGVQPSTVVVGQPSTMTLNLLNRNTAAATGTTVSIPLAGLTITSPATTCGGSVAISGDSLVLTGGTVPANGACTVTAQVSSPTPGTFPSNVPVDAVQSSQGGNTEPSNIALRVNALAPISGAKAFSPATKLRGGGTARATITLTNTNPIALTGAKFTDALPNNLVVAPTPNASTTCGQGTVTAASGASQASLAGGTIPAGGSCTVTFDVTPSDPNVTLNAGRTNLIRAGAVTADGGASNTAPFSAGITLQTGARIVKAFLQDPVGHNQEGTLRLTVQNWNATPLTGITFTDTLPAALTPVRIITSTCSGVASVDTAARSVTLTGAALQPSASDPEESCRIDVRYRASNTTGNHFSVTNDHANFNTGMNFDGVVPEVVGASVNVNPGGPGEGVSATKTFDGAQRLSDVKIVQTSTISMVVTLTNSATTPAAITSFKDDLTAMGQSFAVSNVGRPETTCGGTVNAAAGATLITKTDGAVPANGSCTITVPIRIGGDATPGEHTNTIGGDNEVVTNGNTWHGIYYATVNVRPALTATKTFSPNTISSGQTTALMTIKLNRVAGATSLTDVSFDDSFAKAPFPLQAQAVDSNSCGGAVDLSNGVKLTGGTLPAPTDGAASECAVVVRVGAPAGAKGSWTNVIPAGTVSTAEGVGNNNPTQAIITALSASIGLSKQFSPTTLSGPDYGSRLSLTISNTEGAPTQTGVKLVDALPQGMAVAATPNATFTGNGCSLAPADLIAPAGGATVQLGGAGATVNAGSICTLSVNVVGNAVGNLTNVINPGGLTSAAGLSNTGVAQATVTRPGDADLGVSITNNTNGVTPGGTTTYVVAVENLGQTAVADATLTNDPPAGISYGAWTCTASGGAVCPADSGQGPLPTAVSLPVGGRLTYTVTAAVDANVTGPVVNQASVTMPGAVSDTNPDNNTASDSDPVLPPGGGNGGGPGGPGVGAGGVTAVPVGTPGGLALLSLLVAGAGWLGRRQGRGR